MFDVDGAGNVQVSLLSQETLYIPFTLLTLRPQAYHQRVVGEAHSHSGAEKKRERTHKAERKGHGDVDSSEDDESFHRTLEVRFISASHGHVVAVLKLNICYRSGVIDRSIMFYEPENSVMNRRIQLVDSQSTSLIPGQRYSSSKYIHCVENTTPDDDTSGSQVLVEWGPSEEDFSNGLDIIVRYRCRPFPGVGSFYILVYNDPYQCSLFEVRDYYIDLPAIRNRFVDVACHSALSTAPGPSLRPRKQKLSGLNCARGSIRPQRSRLQHTGVFNFVGARLFPA